MIKRLASACALLLLFVVSPRQLLSKRKEKSMSRFSDAIDVGTSVCQSLFDGLGDQVGGVILMQFQDTHKLSDTPTVRPLGLQMC